MVGLGIRPGLLELGVSVSVWPFSFVGPALMPLRFMVCASASSRTVTLVRALRVGGSFTAWTVTVKELVRESIPPLVVPPLSFRITVITAVPDKVLTGAKVSVPETLGLV